MVDFQKFMSVLSLGAKVPQPGAKALSKEMKHLIKYDLKMGDLSVEVTDESRDEFQMAKSLAMEALEEGELEKAIEHFTEAILLNPTSATYSFIKLVYDLRYPSKLLKWTFDWEYMVRGLVLDKKRGNILKCLMQFLKYRWKDFKHNERETGAYNSVKGVNIVMGHC
ncbi:hypothetical protein GIB67_018674 [Kingdonia uniflora]|uniref:Uncharacterized protein n=1 Tax=Kingdonia uniflora TaxID=39325 RepID=A0A7J7M2L8_9MAGN|nr:hypothetical protein GIB67_018674 [Kingdonia uniflora]